MKGGMDETFWHSDGDAGMVGTNQKAFSILTSRVLDFLEEGNPEQSEKLDKPYEL